MVVAVRCLRCQGYLEREDARARVVAGCGHPPRVVELSITPYRRQLKRDEAHGSRDKTPLIIEHSLSKQVTPYIVCSAPEAYHSSFKRHIAIFINSATMPPKKDEKKAKPSATKIVADKVRLCPQYQLRSNTNAPDSDVWHEKCEQPCRSLSHELRNVPIPSALAD